MIAVHNQECLQRSVGHIKGATHEEERNGEAAGSITKSNQQGGIVE